MKRSTIKGFQARCPKCGGYVFGIVGGQWECHSDILGQPLSARYRDAEGNPTFRPRPGTSSRMCGHVEPVEEDQ